MTFDEALVAARLQAPVIHTYIDGCARLEFEYQQITQVGYDFKDGKESPFVQLLSKGGGSVCYARVEDVRMKDSADLERRLKVV